MGNFCSEEVLPLRAETLDEMERQLFLDRAEILDIYKSFHIYSNAECADDLERSFDQVQESGRTLSRMEKSAEEESRTWRAADDVKLLRVEQFLSLPALRTNPFAPRLYTCFKDEPNGMSIKAFYQMASALSHRAPREVKALVYFRIFDFNDYGVKIKCFIKEDIVRLLEILTGEYSLWEAIEQSHCQGDWREAKAGTTGWTGEFPKREGSTKEVLKEKLAKAQGIAQAAEDEDPESEGRRKSTRFTSLKDAAKKIADKVFAAVDTDDNGELNEAEFEKMTSKIPDFRLKFSVRFA